MSGAHAVLKWQAGSWTIEDTGSTNGTYAEHSYERKKTSALLHGGEIQLGESRVKLVSFSDGSPQHERAKAYLARRDGLTGLLRREHLLRAVEEEMAFAEWSNNPLSVARYHVRSPNRHVSDRPTILEMLALRRAAQRVLERAGHRVVTTRGGREAQVLFEAAQSAGKPSPYDLLVLDMVLNELDDGLVVFERIARIYPEQRCLIVSGHAPTDRGLLAIERGLDWLAKPYTSESLVQAVATALDPLRGDPALRKSRPAVGARKRTGT